MKIFLWASLGKKKVKIEKFRQNDGKRVFKKKKKKEKSLRGKFKFQNRCRRLLSFNEITKGLS